MPSNFFHLFAKKLVWVFFNTKYKHCQVRSQKIESWIYLTRKFCKSGFRTAQLDVYVFESLSPACYFTIFLSQNFWLFNLKDFKKKKKKWNNMSINKNIFKETYNFWARQIVMMIFMGSALFYFHASYCTIPHRLTLIWGLALSSFHG